MTAPIAQTVAEAENLFERADRLMVRAAPVKGWKFYPIAGFFFLIFIVPSGLLTAWIVWTVIEETLRPSPEDKP